MDTPFVIEWPENMEEHIFASKHSLISKDMLDEEIEEHLNTKTIDVSQLSNKQ
jgi:hypothetical protein